MRDRRPGRAHRLGRGPRPIGPSASPRWSAGALLVMPGVVDTHVHLNDPGRADWEGFEHGTRAAAAGGVTTVVDMPLNSVPVDHERGRVRGQAARRGRTVSRRRRLLGRRGAGECRRARAAGGRRRARLQVLPVAVRRGRVRARRTRPICARRCRPSLARGCRCSRTPSGPASFVIRSKPRAGTRATRVVMTHGSSAVRPRPSTRPSTSSSVSPATTTPRSTSSTWRRRGDRRRSGGARRRTAHHRRDVSALPDVRGRGDRRRRDGVQVRAAHQGVVAAATGSGARSSPATSISSPPITHRRRRR